MITVQQLPDGQFDVRDGEGKSVAHKFGGTFETREIAEGAARMLNLFETVEERIRRLDQVLGEAQA